jgi:CRP-like cAMP-binding protein
MDSFLFDMMLAGNLISGFLAAWIGLPLSILGFGLLTILATGAAWWYLRVRTAGQPDALALESVPAFRAVSFDVREWAVRRMQRLDFPAGAIVIRQGDAGDLFYTIARGEADVQIAQDGAVTHSTLKPGDFFGEIALLQDVPRTATVWAKTDLILWGLSREDFDELQERAAEFRESLVETAAARLGQRPNVSIPLATRA